MTTAGWSAAAWPRTGATEAELVHREGSLRLLRYRARPASRGLPLLMVAPVINRAWVLDLTPDASLVAALAAEGIDTFLVDWGRPTLGDRAVGLEALVTRLLPRLERRVLAASGARRLVLGGLCLGGTIAAARAAYAPEHAGLVTLNAPVSFADSGPLGTFTSEECFPVDALLEAFGNMPGALLQNGFYAMKPIQHLSRFRRFWDKLEDPVALEETAALEAWNADNLPVTGSFYRTLIQDLYREDRLARGTLELGGRRLDLRAIRCPVLVASAEDDLICLPGQARALLSLVSSEDRRELRLRGGHIRSFVAPRARKNVARELAAWIRERSS